jgi:Holliday junction resolvasome RuvABC DNA-binding subunit
LELREKITAFVWTETAQKTTAPEQRAIEDAVEGLIALGYKRSDARAAVEEALKVVKDRDTGVVVRTALKFLAKG